MIDKPNRETDDPAETGEDAADAQLAPEAHNPSQDDEPDQAQSLADEALGRNRHHGYDETDLDDTDRVPGQGDDEGGSAPDLVDTMKQMVTNGRIDMSAFRGERNDDDEEGALGDAGLEDDWPRGAE